MSAINCGPAFPQSAIFDEARGEVNLVSAYHDAGGMTLRDYFAAKALQGLLAWPDVHEQRGAREVAELAASYADALIAELSKATGGAQ